MEDNRKNAPEGVPESNEARRIRMSGEGFGEDVRTDDIKVNKVANFFYHNKVKIILISVFAVILTIGLVQIITQSHPDATIIYGGPQYISANQAKNFRAMIESVIEDYNGDGKKVIQLYDFVFYTSEQLEKVAVETDENGEKTVVNISTNRATANRFSDEIFGVDSGVCILSESQYDEVKETEAFMPLTEALGYVPEGSVDGYAVRLSETKLYRYFAAAQIFPRDSVIVMRKLSTMGSILGMKKRAEANHEAGLKLFRALLEFEYPEGYTEPETAE